MLPELPWLLLGHALLSAGTLVVLVLLGVWVYRNGGEITGLQTLLVLIGVAGAWMVQHLAIFVVSDPTALQVLTFGEKFMGYLSAVVWFVFVSQYTHEGYHRRRWIQAVLVGLPVGLLVAVTVPGIRGALIQEFVLYEESVPFTYADIARGPLYFLALVINYTIVSAGLVVLVRFLLGTRRTAWPRILLLTAGAFGVSALNISSIVGFVPVQGFNYAGYGAFPFALATTVAVVRFRLLDVVPVARNSLVESLDDGVVVVDRDGHVIDFNERAVRIRPDLPEFEGEPLASVWPELAEELDRPRSRATDPQLSVDVDGRRRHYSLLVSPVGKATTVDPLGYSLLLRDVTELETSRQQLDEQNRRLDQVASTVSHDLRNPLNVAQGYLTQLEAQVDEDAVETIEEVRHSHDRMRAIIEDVLQIARENETFERTEIDVTATVHRAWDNVDTAGATLVLDGDGRLRADRSKLLRIFENLVRNAVEHSSTSPRSQASEDALDSGAEPPGSGGEWYGDSTTVTVTVLDDWFAVGDDGPGIPPDEQEDVFEFGYTTSETGTGFGLAIVRQLVELHDWTIEYDDSSDGARFVVSGVQFVDHAPLEADREHEGAK